MKHTIYFQNRQKDVPISTAVRALIRKAAAETLREEAFSRPAEISVSFVSMEEIHALNLEFRGKDKPTDVLFLPDGRGRRGRRYRPGKRRRPARRYRHLRSRRPSLRRRNTDTRPSGNSRSLPSTPSSICSAMTTRPRKRTKRI